MNKNIIASVLISALLVASLIAIIIRFGVPVVTIDTTHRVVGPEELIYYMIVRGEPIGEIRKQVNERPRVVKDFRFQGQGLLAYAASVGRERVVRLLLKRGANPNGEVGNSAPLLEAITADHPEIVELLLKAGADPTLPGAFGISPIELTEGNKDMSKYRGMLERYRGDNMREETSPATQDVPRR